MTHNEEEILKLELQNVKRIERLESTVQEIREDIAGLPGRIIQAIDQPPPSDPTWRWAFGIVCVAMGSAYLLLHNQDNNIRSEISESLAATQAAISDHTSDRHPTAVEAQVKELRTKLDLAYSELAQHIDREWAAQRWRGRIDERTELTLQATVKAMESGSAAGRAAAENRGKTSEAIKQLEARIEQ